ncbi:MAG: glycosyltransferase family 39 protein [Chloroflexi bacterium]|nr:glycosyltransferase family 39 protein [Chloroflexota bacterium]
MNVDKTIQRLFKYRLILFLVLGLLLAVLRLNEHLMPAGDNATYIVLGQSLIMGRGYRMISDPRSPEMALYPPGYPLLLAGILALTGTAQQLMAAILPLKLPSVLFFLGIIALVYDLLRRRSDFLATTTALLAAVHPHLLYFATEIGTEIPYLFASLCCLWLFERCKRELSTSHIVALAALIALASYIRSIALVLAFAFVVYLFVQKRAKHAWLLFIVVGVLVVPWFIYGSLLPTTGTSVGLGRSYFALYFASDPYGTARASLSDWIERLAQNIYYYALEIWPNILFAHASEVSTWLGRLAIVFAVMLTLLLLFGFCLETRHGHVQEWYVALFFLSCLCYLWPVARLVVPIVPFALYYFLVAMGYLLLRVKGWRQSHRTRLQYWERFALIAVCAVLALSALVSDVRSIRRNLLYGLGQPVAVYYSRDAEWTNYLQAMDWIVQNTEPQSIVMCRKPDLLYIMIGHQALEYPYSSQWLDLKRSVLENHVAYIIEDAFHWTLTTRDYLRRALQGWLAVEPEALVLVYETDTPHTRVWRVNQLH